MLSGIARGQEDALPSPLGLSDVIRMAVERRDEIAAARARIRAGEARPAIVSALADPMISPSLDHLPFMLGGVDASVTLEQEIPLSRIRQHRRVSALEVVDAANARYASGSAPQADVLRAEVEVARIGAAVRALVGEVRAAEAMLNTSVARPADLPVPELAPVALTQSVPSWPAIKAALTSRPELAAAQADVARAAADVDVMRDMFRPMATVRTGPSYTMAEGRGWMAMVGISLPVWRGKLRAGVDEAQAMRAMADADVRAMTRMIEGQAAAAVSHLQTARERQAALTTDILPRARMAIEPAVASYAVGRLPLVSVIEAIQTLWLVQSELIDADTELGLAWARLGRAIGSYEAIVQ